MQVEIITDAIGSLLNFWKALIISKYNTHLEKTSRTELTILANGPSLGEVLSEQLKFDTDVMVVNSFHKTKGFIKIKPKYYIISAPEFWLPMTDTTYINMQNELEEAIKNKVNWEMIFLIPFKSVKHGYKRKLENLNSKVSVRFYNDTAVDSTTFLDVFLINNKLAMPRPHNVLIPSLMTGIWMGYKQINIYGADHSWLPEIRVSEDNQAIIGQFHFYSKRNEIAAKPMYKQGEQERKLHEILHKLYLSFKAYHTIEAWSIKRGVKIFNKTKGSFIDAFERN